MNDEFGTCNRFNSHWNHVLYFNDRMCLEFWSCILHLFSAVFEYDQKLHSAHLFQV